MEDIISMSDMGLIFEVTDGYGIDRESIRVDLSKEDPGSVRKGEAGMIEITVPLTTSLEHWLPTLDSRLKGGAGRQMIITVEVEPSPNCDYHPQQVFEALEEPWQVSRVRVERPDGSYGWCLVTGWCSDEDGSASETFCAKVGDSSSGFSFLVHGGDWGLRLMSAHHAGEWSLDDASQWGEPYLLLADLTDVEAA